MREPKAFEDPISALQAECDRLRLITDNAPVLLAYLDTQHRYRFMNAAYALRFGRGTSEMLGKTAMEVLGERLWNQVQPHRERVLAGEAVEYEVDIEHRPGDHQRIHCVLNPARDAAGAVNGYVIAILDVTDRKRIAEADRRKDEFLALLAHELRNPLATLVNALHLLRPASAQPGIAQISGMMERQLTQLERIVDDLLDVSRISRGRFELRRAPMSLARAIETAIEGCHSLITSRGHELVTRQPEEPLLIDGDFARIAQVIANLLSNSAKYTEPGGRIEVELSREGSDAVITVRDTGIGIPPQDLGTVFDMFSQVQDHKVHAGGGLGIGLALVRSLVEMHGGQVEAQSRGTGQGSAFIVRVPLLPEHKRAELLAMAPAESKHAQFQRKLKILIADDNADAAASLALLLQTYGHETVTALNGIEACELNETFKPNVIFMDVGMPLLDGLEATRRIRERTAGGAPFIIALTGWGHDADRRRTQEAGMDLHLVKPMSLEQITDVLEKASAAVARA